MMDKIKAKTEQTERVWIFFSLLTSNAKQIAKRIEQRSAERQAAQGQLKAKAITDGRSVPVRQGTQQKSPII